MTNSQDHASKNGCLSSVLRRFLCAGDLPTHPSSDTENPKEDSTIKLQLPPSPTRTTTTASIVARLMGLDSFPNSPKVSLGTIMQKSRSVGSLDFLPNFQIVKQSLNQNPYHRRVRTSVSFQEVPATLLHDLGKSDVSLTPIQEKSKNLGERGGVHTNLQNNKKKNTNKKRQTQSQRVKVKNQEEEASSVPLKIRRTRRVNGDKKNLVDDGFLDKQMCKSRNKTYNHPLPKMGKHDRKEKKKPMLKRRESEYSEEYRIKVLEEVCTLTMAEIEGGIWVDTKVVNNLQEISWEIGQQILQVLLYEMIDELCSSLYR